MVAFSAALVAIFASVGQSLKYNSPSFCQGLECPYFNNTSNETIDGRNVEYRYYPSQLWISTTVVGTDFNEATSTGFQRCFDYISGENANSTKVPMTAPVTVYVTPGAGPYCTTNFTVSFYVPYDYQVGTGASPPQPTESDVFVNQLPDMKVAVLAFGGFGNQDVVTAKAAELSELLNQEGISYDKNHWWFAGYDSPFQVTDRHNEVWFLLE